MSFVYGLLTRLRWPTAVPAEGGQHGPSPVRAAESGGAARTRESSVSDRIRTAISRSLRALELRSGAGRGTARTRARLEEGLRCVVTDGPWTLMIDMSPKVGGCGSAPNPGVLARGALASCLAVGYASWAARLGVELQGIDVEVEADYDVRGELGLGGVRPGYLEVRYRAALHPAAGVSEAEVDRVVALADSHSPLRDVFANGVPLRRIDRTEGGTT
jgi:uncharacterized OsmC-like protein